MDNIIIEKVINNNIISAYEKSGAEVIVMGRGIGFKKKQGEMVPADQISKIFRIKSRTLTEQFKELLANMPLERVRISDEIISHAKDHLKLKLNQIIQNHESKHSCRNDQHYDNRIQCPQHSVKLSLQTAGIADA